MVNVNRRVILKMEPQMFVEPEEVMGSIDPMHKALPMAGRAPNKPLGLALGTSNPRGRQVSSGKHAGICNASAAGTPFRKRWTKGSRGIKGEYRTSRTKLTMSDWSSLM